MTTQLETTQTPRPPLVLAGTGGHLTGEGRVLPLADD